MFFPELIDSPPVLDFEASSLSDQSYPVSAGLVVGGHTHYWIIKPKENWLDWCYESQQIHGFKRDYLVENGSPTDQVYDEICSLLSGIPEIYSDEPSWEQHWFLGLGRRPSAIRDIRSLIPPDKESQFHKAKTKMFMRHNLKRHRADHDAAAIALAAKHLGYNR